MMKKFHIRVNGKEYEVEVEEIGGNLSPVTQVNAPIVTKTAPVTQPAAPAASQGTKAAAPAPTATPASEGAEVVTAPMPGKIMSIKVQVGQQVNAGDLILYLEAMKMENEIFCGTSGTVKEIKVNEGAAVNPGDALVVIA